MIESINNDTESKYKELYDNNPLMLFTLSVEGVILDVNPAVERQLEYTPQEIIGKSVLSVFHPDDHVKVLATVDDFIKNQIQNSPWEFRKITKSGRIIWVSETTRLLVDKNNVSTLLIVCEDISYRKEVEEKLLVNEERLNLAMIGAGDGIWDWDIKNDTVYYSPSWEKMFGYIEGETKQVLKTVIDRVHPEDLNKMLEEVNKYLNHEINTYSYEFRMYHLDGSLIWTLHRAVALFDKNGKAIRMIGTTADTTQRKQIEESLREARNELELRVQERTKELKIANEILQSDLIRIKKTEDELIVAKEKAEESEKLKTSFLQNLSHEIRTPMNGILGFAQLLNNQNISSEKRKSYISIIINSCNQLLNIVTDILTISSLETKQEKLTIKTVNINTILADLLSLFKVQANEKNLSIYFKNSLSNNDAEILSDGTKITQILSNLISNAIKFTENGFVEFGYTNTENEICFYVLDTGIGVAEEDQINIFKRFRQADVSTNRKFGGAGLGLSISDGFAELLGSKINIESKLNQGSKFYFSIPFEKSTNNYQINKDVIHSDSSSTILIAEDDEINFYILREILSVFEFTILHAKNGLEAIEICQTNDSICLVFMDIRMPLLDGLEAAKKIKEFKPDLTIVAQSSYALDFEKDRYNNTVFSSYITKPYQIEDIVEEVKKIIRD